MNITVWLGCERILPDQVHVRSFWGRLRLRRRIQSFIMERDCVVSYIIYIDALEMLYRLCTIHRSIGGSNKIHWNEWNSCWIDDCGRLILSYRFSVLLVYICLPFMCFPFMNVSKRESWLQWKSIRSNSISAKRIYRRMISVHIFAVFFVFISFRRCARSIYRRCRRANVNCESKRTHLQYENIKS